MWIGHRDRPNELLLRNPALMNEAGIIGAAVLAPTDPAILIPLFDRIGIRQKIEQTAIAESALNDAFTPNFFRYATMLSARSMLKR